jgi:hypothetical protein
MIFLLSLKPSGKMTWRERRMYWQQRLVCRMSVPGYAMWLVNVRVLAVGRWPAVNPSRSENWNGLLPISAWSRQ